MKRHDHQHEHEKTALVSSRAVLYGNLDTSQVIARILKDEDEKIGKEQQVGEEEKTPELLKTDAESPPPLRINEDPNSCELISVLCEFEVRGRNR